jgi:hypothetical protein
VASANVAQPALVLQHTFTIPLMPMFDTNIDSNLTWNKLALADLCPICEYGICKDTETAFKPANLV